MLYVLSCLGDYACKRSPAVCWKKDMEYFGKRFKIRMKKRNLRWDSNPQPPYHSVVVSTASLAYHFNYSTFKDWYGNRLSAILRSTPTEC